MPSPFDGATQLWKTRLVPLGQRKIFAVFVKDDEYKLFLCTFTEFFELKGHTQESIATLMKDLEAEKIVMSDLENWEVYSDQKNPPTIKQEPFRKSHKIAVKDIPLNANLDLLVSQFILFWKGEEYVNVRTRRLLKPVSG